jgi:1,4-dihydroxy-2-naphthoate octaprenyltransferase
MRNDHGSLAQAGRWLAASRPGFLLVTLTTALVGISQSQACGCGWSPGAAVATVVLALLTHAGVNLYNDYGDAVGGSDAVNTERLFPFSGGSRVIQDGVFSATQMRDAARVLAILVVGGGVMLAAVSGPGLLVVGLAGLVLGWAYSSPRVALMSRGLGELSVALAWWLIVVGADYVQRHAFSTMATVSGVSPALLVAGILWAAEFPDARADAAVGKRTLVVRWGPRTAALGYALSVALGYLWVWAWWRADWLPFTAWWALGSAPLSLAAAAFLWRHAGEPSRLRPAIALSIAAAVTHGALLTAAFVAVARLR